MYSRSLELTERTNLYPWNTWTVTNLYPWNTWTGTNLYPWNTWTGDKSISIQHMDGGIYPWNTWTGDKSISMEHMDWGQIYIHGTHGLGTNLYPWNTWTGDKSISIQHMDGGIYPWNTWTGDKSISREHMFRFRQSPKGKSFTPHRYADIKGRLCKENISLHLMKLECFHSFSCIHSENTQMSAMWRAVVCIITVSLHCKIEEKPIGALWHTHYLNLYSVAYYKGNR